MATESKAAISITGDNNRIIIGDNNTVVINHGSSNDDQVISGTVKKLTFYCTCLQKPPQFEF